MKIDFKNKQTMALLSAVGILALITVAAVVVLLTLPDASVKVDDFSAMTAQQVQQWATENSLDDQQLVIEYEYSDTVEKDHLISQSIAADQNLGREDVLTVVFSNGPDPEAEVTLPDFTGWTQDQIDQFVEENKLLDVTYEYAVDETIPEGQFIRINITETTVKRGTMIIITISQGQNAEGEEILVPDFSDYTKAKITNWGKANKITINWKEASSETIAKGGVISQDPAAGTTIKTGGKVTITLSTGKAVEIRSLAGMSRAEARKWLSDNGLTGTFSDAYSSSVDYDIVISSSPAGGTISQGSNVQVKVSLGKIRLESFVDKQKSDAENFKNNVNRYEGNLTFSYGEVESDKPVGTIISQSVDAGSYLNPGSEVYFEVSKGRTVQVENRAGSTESDFRSYIEGLGLTLGARSTLYSDTVAKGSIIRHDTGSKKPGDSISYVVSEGAYTPPRFSGTLAAAQSEISAANAKGAGWTIQSAGEEYHDSIAAGNLIPDRQTTSGKTVTVVVSRGPAPKPVSVGSFAGKSFSEFNSFLSANGLKAGSRSEEYNEDIAAGSIIHNDTGEFTPGSSINYTVSLGSRYVNIIDLSSKIVVNDPEGTRNQISSYLTGLGYPSNLIQITTQYSDYTRGELISYSPAGRYDKTSDVISVVISLGPND